MRENAKSAVQLSSPPHLACNSCGYHETGVDNSERKGELKSFVFTGVLNARLELEDRGLKYVCGEVQLDEGPAIKRGNSWN